MKGKTIIGLLGMLLLFQQTYAQLTLSAELRTRTELRDGAGTLKPKGNDASFFTSQRSRLIFNYNSNRVIFHIAIQDTRVWGQDASTFSSTDGNKLHLHEAWASIAFADKTDTLFTHAAVDYFGVKIGRQELVYDDQRLLGNLDWLQEARRHDAVVLKLLQRGWRVDLGAAFNQNTDVFNYNGTYYTPANVVSFIKDSKGNFAPTPPAFIPLINAAGFSARNGTPALQGITSTNARYQNYKALTFLYGAKTFNRTRISALMVVDYFQKYGIDSVKNIAGTDTGYIYGNHFNQGGVNTRATGGVLVNSFVGKEKELAINAGFYYQFGRDWNNQKLKAFTSTVSVLYTKRRFSYTIGWDYLSGNSAFSASSTNHRFDPLYGTPHRFWGLMDYFYVATGSPSGGLNNPFAKVRYAAKGNRFTTELAYHYFALAQHQKDQTGSAISKYLGSEVDLTTAYALNKITTLEYGCSLMAAGSSMEYAKNIQPGTSRLTGFWTYLMLTIKPSFLFK